MKFYSSVRLDIRRISTIKSAEAPIGNHVRVKVVKNKVAAPFREAEFDIMFDGGISIEGDLIDLATKEDVISKSGSWLSYKDIRLGQGRENTKQYLRDNPDLFDEIKNAVLEKRLPSKKSDSQNAKNQTVGSPSPPKKLPVKNKRKRA